MSEFEPIEGQRIREPSELTDAATEGAFAAINKYRTEPDAKNFFSDVPDDQIRAELGDGEIWTENYGWVPADVIYNRDDQPAPPEQPVTKPEQSAPPDAAEPAPPANDLPPQDPPSDTPGEVAAQPPEPNYEQILAEEPTCVMHYDGQEWQPGRDPNAGDNIEGSSTDEAIVAPGKIAVGRFNAEDQIMSPMLFTSTEQNPVVAIVNDHTGLSALVNVDPQTQTVHEQIVKTITDFPSLVARSPENEHEVRILIIDDYEPRPELIEALESRDIRWDREYDHFPLNVAIDSSTGLIVGSSDSQDEFIYEPARPNQVDVSPELEEMMDDIGQNDPIIYCDLESDGEWHSLDKLPQLNAVPNSIAVSRDPDSKIVAEFNNDNTIIAVFNKTHDTDAETPYSAIINLSDDTTAKDAINNLCMSTPQIVREDSVVCVIGQPATDEIVSSFYNFGILNIETPAADFTVLEITNGSQIEIEPGVDIKSRKADGEVGYSKRIVDELFPPINAAAQIVETDFTEAIRSVLNADITEYLDPTRDEVPITYHVDIAIVEHTEASEETSEMSVIGLRLMSTVIGEDEAYHAEAIIQDDKLVVTNLPLNLVNLDGSLNVPASLIKLLAAVAGQAGCNEIIVRTLENNPSFIEAIMNPLYDLYLNLDSNADRLEQLQQIFHSIYIQSAEDLGFIQDSESGDMRRWTPRAL